MWGEGRRQKEKICPMEYKIKNNIKQYYEKVTCELESHAQE